MKIPRFIPSVFRSASIIILSAMLLSPFPVMEPAFAANEFAIVGYKSSGELDVSLDGDGKIATSFSRNGTASASAMVVDSSNRTIVAGTADGQFAVARYNPDGSLDKSFGTNGNGKVLTPFGGTGATARALTLDKNGKIVVAGGANGSLVVARYNENGSLDTTFGNTWGVGIAGVPFTSCSGGTLAYGEARAIAVDDSNRIVLAGTIDCGPYEGSSWALARLSTDGWLDFTFGSKGQVITDLYPYLAAQQDLEVATAIAIDGSGRIVVGGHAYVYSTQYDVVYTSFVVARYSSLDGQLDKTFGGGYGVVDIFLDTRSSLETNEANALVIDTAGRIVVAGKVYSGWGHNFALARLNPNGTLDTTFNGDGKVITSFGWVSSEVHAVKFTSTGKILAAGATEYNSSMFALARYNSNGSLDTSFDGDGKVTTDFTCQGPEAARAIAFQSWGLPLFYTRTLVAGWASGTPCQ